MSAEQCHECGVRLPDGEPAYLDAAQTRVLCKTCYDAAHPACPHCAKRLPARVQGRVSCAACGEAFFVAPTRRGFGSAILSAAEAGLVSEQLYSELKLLGDPEQVYRERKAFLKKMLGVEPSLAQVVSVLRPEIEQHKARTRAVQRLQLYGVGAAAFMKRAEELRKQLGHEPDIALVKYDLWEAVLAAQSGNERVYRSLAADLFDDDRDPRNALRAAVRARLIRFRAERVQRVRLAAAADACGICRHAAGQVFDVDEALRSLPAPHADCRTGRTRTRHFGLCRCSYQAV